MLDATSFAQVLGTHLLQGFSFIHLLDGLLQVLQAQDQYRDVVERAACCTFSQNDLNSLSRCDMLIVVKLLLSSATVDFTLGAALRMVVWRQVVGCFRGDLLFDSPPDGIHALLVVKSFKNSIAPDHEEIEVIFQFETAYLRIADDDVCIATVLLFLGFNVTKGT